LEPLRIVLPFLGYLVVGIVLFIGLRKHALAATVVAIVLGVLASGLLLGILNEVFLPEAGMFQALIIALLAALAAALALRCLLEGPRRPLNWIALILSLPPLLFLIIFGLGELLGPAH